MAFSKSTRGVVAASSSKFVSFSVLSWPNVGDAELLSADSLIDMLAIVRDIGVISNVSDRAAGT
jgi:hypothetical protein